MDPLAVTRGPGPWNYEPDSRLFLKKNKSRNLEK
jgi:hypothetical protein